MSLKQQVESLKKLVRNNYTKDFETVLRFELHLHAISKALDSDTGDFLKVDIKDIPEKIKFRALQEYVQNEYIKDDTLEEICLIAEKTIRKEENEWY